jgi:hypothetical protein
MDEQFSEQQGERRGGDRRKNENPVYPGPERRKGDRRGNEASRDG